MRDLEGLCRERDGRADDVLSVSEGCVVKAGPRILIFDSEIAKTLYATYPSYKPVKLRAEDIIQDWFTICTAWKWVGSKKINCVSIIDDKKRYEKNKFDDYHVIKTFYDVIKEADVIVGHNMERFDWQKFMERVICHRLPPLPAPKIVDSMKMAKKFGFSYKSLAYLTKRLNLREKLKNGGNDMWNAIVQGKGREHVEECVVYCKGDIEPAEDLYNRLAPYVPNSMLPNMNLYRGTGVQCCPCCSSNEFTKDGFLYTPTTKKQRYHCNECGKYFTDAKSLKRVVMR